MNKNYKNIQKYLLSNGETRTVVTRPADTLLDVLRQQFGLTGAKPGCETPGFIIVCHALSQIHPDAGDENIEEWLQSNLCRCTCYEEIQATVKSVLAGEQACV